MLRGGGNRDSRLRFCTVSGNFHEGAGIRICFLNPPPQFGDLYGMKLREFRGLAPKLSPRLHALHLVEEMLLCLCSYDFVTAASNPSYASLPRLQHPISCLAQLRLRRLRTRRPHHPSSSSSSLFLKSGDTVGKLP